MGINAMPADALAPKVARATAGTVLASELTHEGQVTYICVSKLTIIGSDDGFSPGRRQAIIWTCAGILSMGPPGKNFNDILIEIYTFSFKKFHLKKTPGKWRPFCLGLNVLNLQLLTQYTKKELLIKVRFHLSQLLDKP